MTDPGDLERRVTALEREVAQLKGGLDRAREDTEAARVCGYDRAFYSGKHKRHGMNVQVLADPAGRLVWVSPALPGARHDMGAAREYGLERVPGIMGRDRVARS